MLTKKIAFFLIIIPIIAIFNLGIYKAHAQTNSPDPYGSYLSSLNDFYNIRKTFEASRARYNSFKTIQAKQSATNDGKLMLNKGNETLRRYIVVAGGIFQGTDPLEPQTKERILNDMRIHGEYLINVENTLTAVPTFAEINSYSEALRTRYGYINSTVSQATAYMDVVRLLQLTDEMKIIIEQIDNLNRTLPQEEDKTQLVGTWVTNARQETLKDETTLRNFMNSIYPQSTSTTEGKPLFEQRGVMQIPTQVTDTRSRLRARANDAENTYNVLVDIYQQL
jgi:hypothetical protein